MNTVLPTASRTRSELRTSILQRESYAVTASLNSSVRKKGIAHASLAARRMRSALPGSSDFDSDVWWQYPGRPGEYIRRNALRPRLPENRNNAAPTTLVPRSKSIPSPAPKVPASNIRLGAGPHCDRSDAFHVNYAKQAAEVTPYCAPTRPCQCSRQMFRLGPSSSWWSRIKWTLIY